MSEPTPSTNSFPQNTAKNAAGNSLRLKVGTDCIVIGVEVGMERLTRRRIQTYPLKNQSPNKSMNKKLQSKDEKKNMYKKAFEDKFPGVKDFLKDEKKVAGWSEEFEDRYAETDVNVAGEWRTVLLRGNGIEGYQQTARKEELKNFIRDLLSQSRKEWQEEQNKVVNSGRKLFQEGQKAERERIIGEVEKTKIDYTDVIREIGSAMVASELRTREMEHNAPIDDLLRILKGEK